MFGDKPVFAGLKNEKNNNNLELQKLLSPRGRKNEIVAKTAQPHRHSFASCPSFQGLGSFCNEESVNLTIKNLEPAPPESPEQLKDKSDCSAQ